MSIPQPQIIYTGMNVAVPDWKTFNRDLNARMDMIRREKQQERQFEIQRQDQLNREFLRTVDIDRLNYANSSLQQTAANIYQAFDDTVSSIVQDKKGQMSIQDTLKVKALASRAEQELIKYKNWDDTWKKDMSVVMDATNPLNPKLTEECKRDIMNYDMSTPYTTSRLQIKPWTDAELYNKLNKDITDAKTVSTFEAMRGKGDILSKQEFDERFWETETAADGSTQLVFDENNKPIPKWDAQVSFMADAITSNAYSQGRERVSDVWNGLKPDDRELWEDIAVSRGVDKEYAPVLYQMEKDGGLYNPFMSTAKVTTDVRKSSTSTKTTKKKDVDLRTGLGDLRGGRVDLTGRIGGAMDAEGNDVSILAGKNGASLTKIEYMTNPKTGNKEWMVYGQYTKPNPDLGEVAMGKRTVTEEFLVPYNEVKEPIEEEYIVKGMDAYKPKESFDEATEAKIQSFMSKNKIKDKNEAIKILKENKMI